MCDDLRNFFRLATLWELQQFQKIGGYVPSGVLAAAEAQAALKREAVGGGEFDATAEMLGSEEYLQHARERRNEKERKYRQAKREREEAEREQLRQEKREQERKAAVVAA